MGFGRFVLVKGVQYGLALVATMSILWLGTATVIQEVIVGSANAATQQYKQDLLRTGGAHSLSSSQLSTLLTSYRQSYLNRFGFGQPFPFNFFHQMSQILTFHLGTSYFLSYLGSHDVAFIIAAYMPRTILLFTSATLILIVLGVIIGLMAAKAAGSIWDRLVPFVAVIHSSLPAWWLGFILVAGFAYDLRILPSQGMTSVPAPTNPFLYGLDVLTHMTLPMLTLLIVGLGGFAYVVRSLVINTMGEDFVLTARARGISESRILFRHVLRTASPSITTQAILAVTVSFGGALLTEVVFNWPGIGLLTYNAIESNDLPIVLGVVFVTTIILLIGLFIGELTYGLLDPRIRVSSE